MDIGKEELAAFQGTAAAFAKREILPMLEHESADGDLSRIPAILEEAQSTGILATARESDPGFEAGVWGALSLDYGPGPSLLMLSELARVCAGVAMNIHAAGLAARLLGQARKKPSIPPARAAVALCEGGFPPTLAVIRDPSRSAPARIETMAQENGDGFVLSGRKDFVFHSHGCESFVVLARMDKEWVCFAIPADAPGLTIEDVGHRMGLRGCPLAHLALDSVKAGPDQWVSFENAADAVADHLACLWMGMTAMAAGAARSALDKARRYASERYQGWTEIVHHPVVNSMLLADCEGGLAALEGLLLWAAGEEGGARSRYYAGAKAKLAGAPIAHRVVTDSLQVFGGYGYMEDYGMEKKYRDVNTLCGAGGGPRDLRLVLSALAREED